MDNKFQSFLIFLAIYVFVVTIVMIITIFLLHYFCLTFPESPSSLSLLSHIKSSHCDLDESPSLIKTIPTDILDDNIQSKFKPDTIIISATRK